jgi:hypothetical protein
MKLQTLLSALGLVMFLIPPLISRSSPIVRRQMQTEDNVIHRAYINMPRFSLGKSLNLSTDVVRGTITSATAVFPDSLLPYTLYTMDVTWNLKNELFGSVSIRIPGASENGRTFFVDRAPNIVVGDDIIIMLRAIEEESAYEVVGLDQGVYRIAASDTGATLVSGAESDDLPFDTFATELYSTWLTTDTEQH